MPQIPRETDVFIAGGGPAGLAAAIACCQKGFRVVVADVCRPPIEKPCGEGLMPDSVAALRRLGVGIPPGECFPFTGARFEGSGVSVEASFPNGYGMGVRRRVLHEALVSRAEAAGAALLWGVRVSGISDQGALVDGSLVRCRWIIGADGENSQIRRWGRLDHITHYARRFGFRKHFRVRPWSGCVEVWWGTAGQVYITPVRPNEICVVLLSRDRHQRIDAALAEFPELRNRIEGAPADAERGAVSASRRLRHVARGGVALIGDSSGSVDAITGEGLCLAFRQAEALALALEAGDLRAYDREHRRLLRRPALMARLMLSMDRFPLIRHRALHAMAAKPAIFSNLLAAHVAERPTAKLVTGGIVPLGLRMMAVR
ncbi:MAG TPA: FAD-dependent monooxygenase [Bryobacteraceae bacterium]|nr:FAD-dependent monooxygenase [Bryobacteraceae bacterium]